MDSFFSSVTLYHQLLSDNIYCTGTLRSNRRNFPPDLKDVAKRGLATRGDMMARQDGNVSVCVWQPVTFMLSGHNPDKHLCHMGDHTTDCFLMHHAQYNLYST